MTGDKEGMAFSLVLGPDRSGPPMAFFPKNIGKKEAARIPCPSFYDEAILITKQEIYYRAESIRPNLPTTEFRGGKLDVII